MREIKFRAWLEPRWEEDDDGNQMYYDIQESYDMMANVKPHDPMDAFSEWLNNEYATVEQYTGLKDKNSKEIYEGDIVKDNSTNGNYVHTYVVKFGKHNIECCGCCYGSHQSVGFYMVKTNCEKEAVYADDDEWENLEIIGNIHENKELLK